jgi:hypothetical protein
MLQAAGFAKQAQMSHGDEFNELSVNVYGCHDDSTDIPRFFVDISIAEHSYWTWVDDVEDYVDLLVHPTAAVAACGALGDCAEDFESEGQETRRQVRERSMFRGPK